MYVLVLDTGWEIIGPFASEAEASAYAKQHHPFSSGHYGVIRRLTEPPTAKAA